MRPRFSWRVSHNLQRRIFLWFGASIFITGLVVAAVLTAYAPGRSTWHQTLERARGFVGGQFEAVWDDPDRRDFLARSAAEQLGLAIVLEDARGADVRVFGHRCEHGDFKAAVLRQGEIIGRVRVCGGSELRPRGGGAIFLVLAVAGGMLWAASGLIATRLIRPLGELVRVANEIGAGRLAARVRLGRSRVGEIGVLADAINDMADRIQKQMADQRELLAAVSHEIRSPLARMRVLIELARDSGDFRTTQSQLDDIECELIEINELTGKLLASSRLDFSALENRELLAKDLVASVVERAGFGSEVVECPAELLIFGDPTLITRALSNLLDNATKYAGGVNRVRVIDAPGKVLFLVSDRGPGFEPGELPRVFDSFVRGDKTTVGSSLGLGLALVRRIAIAHGGDAWAKNLPEGGAEVGFSIPRGRSSVAQVV